MISSLKGIHGGMEDDGAIVVDVHGVGYHVYVNDRDRKTLNARGVGSEVSLVCRTTANENAVTIYGFINVDDRRAFDRLQKVAGIGPSVSLRLLSVHDALRLRHMLAVQDLSGLTAVPGIGKKTAEKLVMEAKL